MATKKDLVEAQSFSRRRLTTAFVSGAPGGREVEPHRPLRAVVGGLALTAVLVLGSMAFGWLRSSLPADWEDNRLIIAEDSGARYVSLKGLLHPVVNTTSARLLIPSKDFRVLAVPDEELASIDAGRHPRHPRGTRLPHPARAAGQQRLGRLPRLERAGVDLDRRIPPRAPRSSAGRSSCAPTTAPSSWPTAAATRWPTATSRPSRVALRLDGRPAVAAPAAWLNLFPEGPALAPLTIDGLGTPLPGLPAGATVGSVLTLDGDGRRYVVLPSGDLEPLPEVANEMYRLGSGASGREIPVQAAQIAQLQVRPQRFAPPEWPAAYPTAITDTPCATLTAAAGAPPEVTLGSTTVAPPEGTAGRTVVETGSGALVRAVSGTGAQQGPGARRRPDRHGLRPPGRRHRAARPAGLRPGRRRAGAAVVDRAAALGPGAGQPRPPVPRSPAGHDPRPVTSSPRRSWPCALAALGAVGPVGSASAAAPLTAARPASRAAPATSRTPRRRSCGSAPARPGTWPPAGASSSPSSTPGWPTPTRTSPTACCCPAGRSSAGRRAPTPAPTAPRWPASSRPGRSATAPGSRASRRRRASCRSRWCPTSRAPTTARSASGRWRTASGMPRARVPTSSTSR